MILKESTIMNKINGLKLIESNAVNATKAAVEEGIVPGGGTTLAHISDELLDWAKENLIEDELIGALIVEKALIPMRKKH